MYQILVSYSSSPVLRDNSGSKSCIFPPSSHCKSKTPTKSPCKCGFHIKKSLKKSWMHRLSLVSVSDVLVAGRAQNLIISAMSVEIRTLQTIVAFQHQGAVTCNSKMLQIRLQKAIIFKQTRFAKLKVGL